MLAYVLSTSSWTSCWSSQSCHLQSLCCIVRIRSHWSVQWLHKQTDRKISTNWRKWVYRAGVSRVYVEYYEEVIFSGVGQVWDEKCCERKGVGGREVERGALIVKWVATESVVLHHGGAALDHQAGSLRNRCSERGNKPNGECGDMSCINGSAQLCHPPPKKKKTRELRRLWAACVLGNMRVNVCYTQRFYKQYVCVGFVCGILLDAGCYVLHWELGADRGCLMMIFVSAAWEIWYQKGHPWH